eukprot:gene10411-8359_t
MMGNVVLDQVGQPVRRPSNTMEQLLYILDQANSTFLQELAIYPLLTCDAFETRTTITRAPEKSEESLGAPGRVTPSAITRGPEKSEESLPGRV